MWVYHSQFDVSYPPFSITSYPFISYPTPYIPNDRYQPSTSDLTLYHSILSYSTILTISSSYVPDHWTETTHQIGPKQSKTETTQTEITQAESIRSRNDLFHFNPTNQINISGIGVLTKFSRVKWKFSCKIIDNSLKITLPSDESLQFWCLCIFLAS